MSRQLSIGQFGGHGGDPSEWSDVIMEMKRRTCERESPSRSENKKYLGDTNSFSAIRDNDGEYMTNENMDVQKMLF